MSDIKTRLSANWNKEVVDILRKEMEQLDSDQHKRFFESVGTLMANQVRDLITKSVNTYVDFFKQYEKPRYALPSEIVKREYDAESEFEMSFIVLKLQDTNDSISFETSLHNVNRELKNTVENIVATSQNLPRPENSIARADKMHLWEVPTEDDIVKNAEFKIEEILTGNLNAVEKAVDIFSDFQFILTEDTRLQAYLEDPKIVKTIEKYREKIQFYIDTIEKIRSTLPLEIRMNMILINCYDLNNKLIEKCYNHIAKILSKIMSTTNEKAGEVIQQADAIKNKLQERP